MFRLKLNAFMFLPFVLTVIASILISLIIGIFIGKFLRKKFAEAEIGSAEIEAENIKNAKELKETLEKLEVVIKTKTGNGDKLFGSITSQDISDALKKQHKIEIDKRKIELKENIKSLCTLTVPVRVYPEIVATVKVSIEKE